MSVVFVLFHLFVWSQLVYLWFFCYSLIYFLFIYLCIHIVSHEKSCQSVYWSVLLLHVGLADGRDILQFWMNECESTECWPFLCIIFRDYLCAKGRNDFEAVVNNIVEGNGTFSGQGGIVLPSSEGGKWVTMFWVIISNNYCSLRGVGAMVFRERLDGNTRYKTTLSILCWKRALVTPVGSRVTSCWVSLQVVSAHFMSVKLLRVQCRKKIILLVTVQRWV